MLEGMGNALSISRSYHPEETEENASRLVFPFSVPFPDGGYSDDIFCHYPSHCLVGTDDSET
jgi:hypothetical protein